jgi:hypothetical protein
MCNSSSEFRSAPHFLVKMLMRGSDYLIYLLFIYQVINKKYYFLKFKSEYCICNISKNILNINNHEKIWFTNFLK